MSAKDYEIAHGIFNSFIAHKTKNKLIMSADRRPLTEMECIDIAYQYLKRKTVDLEDNTVIITKNGKPVFKMILLEQGHKEQSSDLSLTNKNRKETL